MARRHRPAIRVRALRRAPRRKRSVVRSTPCRAYGEPTLIDTTLDELTRELIAARQPDVVAVTAPFPGNVYGAFRMARAIRAAKPKTTLVLGGGWVNTELRSLREPRVFDYFDYVTLDDGERPLLNLLTRLCGRSGAAGAHLRAPRQHRRARERCNAA
jgi:hypothetical protein